MHIEYYTIEECLKCYHKLSEHIIINDHNKLRISCHNTDNRDLCDCNGGFKQQFEITIDLKEVNNNGNDE